MVVHEGMELLYQTSLSDRVLHHTPGSSCQRPKLESDQRNHFVRCVSHSLFRILLLEILTQGLLSLSRLDWYGIIIE